MLARIPFACLQREGSLFNYDLPLKLQSAARREEKEEEEEGYEGRKRKKYSNSIIFCENFISSTEGFVLILLLFFFSFYDLSLPSHPPPTLLRRARLKPSVLFCGRQGVGCCLRKRDKGDCLLLSSSLDLREGVGDLLYEPAEMREMNNQIFMSM